MIDVENDIFTEIANELQSRFGNIFITGEYVKTPPSFPCVSVIEVNNVTVRNTTTSLNQENHAELMYEVNVYSNKTTGKKAECKKIIECIDDILISMNFIRTMLEPVANGNDIGIYRVLGRYRAVVSKDKVLFRR